MVYTPTIFPPASQSLMLGECRRQSAPDLAFSRVAFVLSFVTGDGEGDLRPNHGGQGSRAPEYHTRAGEGTNALLLSTVLHTYCVRRRSYQAARRRECAFAAVSLFVRYV